MSYYDVEFIDCPYCDIILMDQDWKFGIEQLDKEFDTITVICQECGYSYNVQLEITREYFTSKIKQPLDQKKEDHPNQKYFNFYEKEKID